MKQLRPSQTKYIDRLNRKRKENVERLAKTIGITPAKVLLHPALWYDSETDILEELIIDIDLIEKLKNYLDQNQSDYQDDLRTWIK